jgi:hypothetical protein
LLIPLLGFLVAAAPGKDALSSSSTGDLERNRELLHKWQADPEHAALLQHDLRAFWALPKAKQKQLRQLDRELHQLDPATQKRLRRVADRYMAWLERLPAERRRAIEGASDPEQRLQRIKALREQQWIERLPKRVQVELAKLAQRERSEQVRKLREQERQQRNLWKRPVSAGPRAK